MSYRPMRVHVPPSNPHGWLLTSYDRPPDHADYDDQGVVVHIRVVPFIVREHDAYLVEAEISAVIDKYLLSKEK